MDTTSTSRAPRSPSLDNDGIFMTVGVDDLLLENNRTRSETSVSIIDEKNQR